MGAGLTGLLTICAPQNLMMEMHQSDLHGKFISFEVAVKENTAKSIELQKRFALTRLTVESIFNN